MIADESSSEGALEYKVDTMATSEAQQSKMVTAALTCVTRVLLSCHQEQSLSWESPVQEKERRRPAAFTTKDTAVPVAGRDILSFCHKGLLQPLPVPISADGAAQNPCH